MQSWIIRGITAVVISGAAAGAEPDLSSPQPTGQMSSLRAPETEAKHLHQLIADAKAKGVTLDPQWITRLNELEPFHPGPANLESPSTSAEPVPSPDEHPSRGRNPLDQGNDNCPATVIASLPYEDSGTTVGRANNFTPPPECVLAGSTAPDVIYQFTATVNGPLWISVLAGYNSVLYVRYGGACPGDNASACADLDLDNNSFVSVNMSAGTTYYIIVDGVGTSAGTYTLRANTVCSLNCQSGTIPECTEIPGPDHGLSDCDGGCWNDYGTVRPFQTIVPGATVCGRTFFSSGSGFDDYDWYEFEIAQACTVRWTVRSEWPLLIGMEGTGCNGFAIGAYTVPCFSTEVHAFLPAGTYRAGVTPGGSLVEPAGILRDYTATLYCSGQNCNVDGMVYAPGSVSGNTCQSTSHCSYRPSPDQIIAVEIPHSGTWRFSLCNSPILWDSYIYLSQTCCGTAIASNDDDCLLLSQFDACINNGIYYLTVEGFSSPDCGAYTLEVSELHGSCCYTSGNTPQCQDGVSSCFCTTLGGTWNEGLTCTNTMCGPRPLCQDDAVYGQQPYLPSETWDAVVSDYAVAYREFDNFSGLVYPISSVRFWATAGDASFQPCVEQPQALTISFHADSAGWPRRANSIGQYNLVIPGTFLGNYPSGATNWPVYQYDAVLPVPCNLPSGWISIQSQAASGNPDCRLWWLTSPQGNNNHRLLWNDSFSSEAADLSFCLVQQPPCANPLSPPQQVTCNTVTVNGQQRIQLSWQALNAGTYEIWSTTTPNNDGNPDGGLDSLWQSEARIVVANNFGIQTWVDPNPITALYKNYVMLQVCRPPNDECENSLLVFNGLTHYTNNGADSDGPAPSCGGLGSDVWFRYPAACTGTVTVSTCITGLFYDSVIEIFGGTCENLGAPIACNDDWFCGLASTVTFAAAAGNTYLIRVGGYNGAQGNGVLSINCP